MEYLLICSGQISSVNTRHFSVTSKNHWKIIPQQVCLWTYVWVWWILRQLEDWDNRVHWDKGRNMMGNPELGNMKYRLRFLDLLHSRPCKIPTPGFDEIQVNLWCRSLVFLASLRGDHWGRCSSRASIRRFGLTSKICTEMSCCSHTRVSMNIDQKGSCQPCTPDRVEERFRSRSSFDSMNRSCNLFTKGWFQFKFCWFIFTCSSNTDLAWIHRECSSSI